MPTKVELTREEPFSHSHKYFGQKAKFFSLTNSKNNKVCVMNLGGCVTSWIVHDAHAKSIDVVCGFASLQGYEQDEFFMGQIVGRVANRIANGQFSVNGRDYQLTCNNGPNCNHSAQRNYGYRLWDASIIKDMDTSDEKLQLKLVDNPEDDLDFPGRCNVCATYSYTVNDELKIEIIAECDEISPVNMTSHIYFNLDGHGHGSISEQEIQINASHYLPTDESDLVTGEIVPVNFEKPKTCADIFGDMAPNIDRTFCLNGWSAKTAESEMKHAARVKSSKNDIMLDVYSNQPGIHLYTSKYLDVKSKLGKDGVAYGPNSAFCLESQNFPNAVNLAHFPNTLALPSKRYKHDITYKLTHSL